MSSNMQHRVIKLFIVLLLANLFFMAMLYIQYKKSPIQSVHTEAKAMHSEQMSARKQAIQPVDIYVYGQDNAPNELFVFTRYSCSFCKRFYLESFEGELKSELENGNLKVLFPFNINLSDKNELLMAKTAEIAREFGLYEKVQKHFYSLETNPDSLEIIQVLPQMGIDEKLYHSRLSDSIFYKRILEQVELGNKRQVKATPIFFLNGARLDGYAGKKEFAEFYSAYKKD